jgi:PEGA domain-containing protein
VRIAASIERLLLGMGSVLLAASAIAKDQPPQVVLWPDSAPTVVRFSFGKLKEIASIGNRRSYLIDTTAENLWGKVIPTASFSLYLFDKNRVRIGEGYISLNNVGVGETVKFQVAMDAAGVPASFGLAARDLPQGMGPPQAARKVSITVNSVPQGALVKLDGTEVGTTPKIVEVSAGKHRLDFSKEGFNPGAFPLEIGPNDTSGGSVSYELGSSVHDTVELRDGSVINGDLESVSATEVVVRIAGKDAGYDRNQVKRILLVERGSSQEALQPAVPKQ